MKKKYYPFVSVCTPTFNRRPFIENIIKCYKNQKYPKKRMEWIIIDDGTDKVQDIFDKHKIHNLKYFATEKMNLGEKRNYMHTKTKGSIIVYMDDDDYYPPERVQHAVERLQENPDALCAGSSELYVYFKTIKKMIQFGPYGPRHSTAGTFAFRKKMLDQTQYDNNAALAEERAFLKDYTIPFVQLDPLKTILVFSHEHNTFDKRELLKQPESQVMRTSDKTVDTFIQNDNEVDIKHFFMNEIDGLLDNYEPGLPINKPEVIKQTQEIKERREKMQQEHNQQEANTPTGIIVNMENGGKKDLTKSEIVSLINNLQKKNAELSNYVNSNPPIHNNDNEGNRTQMTSSQIVNLITTLQTKITEITNKYNIEKEQYEKIISKMSDTINASKQSIVTLLPEIDVTVDEEN